MDKETHRLFDLGSATTDETLDFVAKAGAEPYRAKQLYNWIHKRFAASFDEMTDMPKPLRERFKQLSFFQGPSIKMKKEDGDGTIKYLLELQNHNIINGSGILIETALMSYRHGAAVCVSSQAGCRMGCVFCRSGKGGLIRNLTAGEMLAQVYAAARDSGKTVSNVTIMGSGEPLDNMTNTLRFIKLISEPQGMGISKRRITLSTCGLTDKINALAKEKLQITLAVSLHAPNDTIRRELVPSAKAYPIEELLTACRTYGNTTKRRVTFEYAMIDGVNDQPEHARELVQRLKRMLCHVNLIPVNGDSGPYRASGETAVRRFKETLESKGVETTVRRTLGSGVSAACGQLRAKHL